MCGGGHFQFSEGGGPWETIFWRAMICDKNSGFYFRALTASEAAAYVCPTHVLEAVRSVTRLRWVRFGSEEPAQRSIDRLWNTRCYLLSIANAKDEDRDLTRMLVLSLIII